MALSRRWFQIHLSTAIVLMFVAGALMWANFREMPLDPERQQYDSEETYNRALIERAFSYPYWGWPCVVYEEYLPFPYDKYAYGMTPIKPSYKWNWKGVTMNALAALAILFAFAIICEGVIRRRDKRKVAP